MNAAIVYSVARALPKEEQLALYKMLQADMSKVWVNKKKLKRAVLTDSEAIDYLITNIFSKGKK